MRFGPGQVRRGVHLQGVSLGLHDVDGKAGAPGPGAAPVSPPAPSAPGAGARTPEGNPPGRHRGRGAGKKAGGGVSADETGNSRGADAGEIDGPAATVEDHLDHVGVRGHPGVGSPAGRGRHDHLRVPPKQSGQLGDELRGSGWSPWMLTTRSAGTNPRSWAASARRSLPEGWSAWVISARPPKPSTQARMRRAVGGHPEFVQPLNQPGLLVDPLNQRLPQDRRQGLAGEPGGPVAGRDEGDKFHNQLS